MSTIKYLEIAQQRMSELVRSDLASRINNANEAKTRLLLIDEVLDILGWPKMDFNPEESTSTGGYTDYRLAIDDEPKLIVEAKRIGFVSPFPRSIQSPDYTNTFLYSSGGSEMQLLLKQCQSYCTQTGIPYAVATTGNIWIIMVGFRYGIEWGKLRSFVFHSLEDVLQRFGEFYGLISKIAVTNNSLEEKFSGMVLVKAGFAVRPREKLSPNCEPDTAPDKQIIESFFEKFMGDITKPGQESMLEHCYVSNRKLDEFSQELQQLLTTNVALTEQDFPVETIEEESLENTIEIQFAANNPRTILLVGNIGAGKTTFLYRFISQQSSSKNVCVVIDLINRVQQNTSLDYAEQQRISEIVLERIEKNTDLAFDPFSPEVLRGCFEVEVGRFKKQRMRLYEQDTNKFNVEEESYIFKLAEDKYKHLIGYLRYMKKKRKRTWIAFDNVDRGTDKYQEFVYAFAHQLSAEAGCVTLISMREDTFLEAQDFGFLDVRSSDVVFQIKAPEIRQVVSKRRRFIDRLVQEGKLPRPFRSHTNLIDVLLWHINSLLLENDDFARYIITTFSLNNIRYGLQMIKSYYTSPHSTLHEFIHNSDSERNFDHSNERNRFLQALMLTNSWSYKEHSSGVFNIFSVDPVEQTSHFLMLRMLAYLNLERKIQSSRKTVKYEKLRDDFIFLGYAKHHLNNAIRRLISAGLVISPTLTANPTTDAREDIPDPFPKEVKISISAKGLCYLQRLASLPYYQTRVGEDTIWYNESLANSYIRCITEATNLHGNSSSNDLLLATEAREIFIQYLKKSLLEESQSLFRHTAKDWVRLINDVVERAVFGDPITQSLYINTDSDNIERESKAIEPESVVINDNILRKKPSPNSGAIRQYSLAGFQDGVDYDQVITEAAAAVGDFPKDLKVQGSLYLVRILWALEVSSMAGVGPLRPAKVAELIRRYANIAVESTNVARFFREQKRNGEFTHLWRENPSGHYTINSIGRDKLRSILQGDYTNQ